MFLIKHAFKKHIAFTLAEVLITLGIIGIVAAMTLPSLINKYTERETVTKVKKFYSVINQALLMAIKDNGYVDEWTYNNKGFDENDPVAEKSSEALFLYLRPYLKVSKICGVDAGCIGDKYNQLNKTTNTAKYDTSRRYYKVLLNDGSAFWLRDNYNGLAQRNECNGTNDDGSIKNMCGMLWYDVNGKKQPNQFGVDVFVFTIHKNRIIPHSYDDCKKNAQGWGCSTYVIQKGDMKYYYK